ncbi:MAG: DUF1565 domain-containing protein, partial [Planctomycetes bacterium]|nr:DUF1565 domain-containing protein [Planctomycetota bacterium]
MKPGWFAGALLACSVLIAGLPPPDGRQVPGDCNQDALVDISDAICLLGHLFLGSPPSLPCAGGRASDPGNLSLLDFTGESVVDISDGIATLLFLFSSGNPHPLGSECVPNAGCPDRCGSCVPLPEIDVPDGLFVDADCDGIDGDKRHTVFVAPPSFGSDANPGTMNQPVATIEKGIQLAAAAGKDVYVAKGEYRPFRITLQSGVSLYGQFDGTPAWGRAPENATVVLARGTTAVFGERIADETHIEGFEIVAADAQGAGDSSYGIRLWNSKKVVIAFNVIRAGKGAPGEDGRDGDAIAAAEPGGRGGVGGPACDGCLKGGTPGAPGESACNRPGGTGGQGGYEGTDGGGGEGGSGWDGNPRNPGAPGPGGPGSSFCGRGGGGGGAGIPGADGAAGENGVASDHLFFVNGEYGQMRGGAGQSGRAEEGAGAA